MKRFVLFCFLLISATAYAHVGNKDVFETVNAGPYKLFVTIRPPVVIPGVAAVEIRTAGGPALSQISIVPLPLTGEGAKHPPTADVLTRSTTDPNFYTGAVWIMAPGSWQVRMEIDGGAGHQTASVPVLAVPVATLKMQRGMGFGLAALGLFLVLSMAGVVAAAIREGRLAPGLTPTPTSRRRSLFAMAASLVIMGLMVYGGSKWWNVEAAGYAENIYARPQTTATLSGNQLDLLVKPFVREDAAVAIRERYTRSNDDFLPDHGHLIHLYAIRMPEMDAVFHLHPDRADKGDFRMALPSMPPGHYRLFGDVVHKSGFPETLLAGVDVPDGLPAVPLAPEDAEALPPALDKGPLGSSYKLPDGYTMRWDHPASLTANTGYSFHFVLLDPQGQPAKDMQPYLGMAGHAAFVKTDGSTFAHTHPEGSASMQAVMLANGGMPGMASAGPVAPAVDFPYGFPSPGAYRIFIQMKHGTTVETGVFDALVR